MTIDWGNKIINVFKTDMVQVQATPTEIWQLDIPTFKANLGDMLDDEAGMAYPNIFNHNPSVSVGGAILAKVVEILEPYTVTFEDGQYAVNLVGANSNIGDRVNVNQVSIRSANSAGLQDLTSLQAASFGGGAVSYDVVNGVAGTVFPIGTKGVPSNNWADAVTIAQQQNMDTIFVNGYGYLGAGDVLDGYTIIAQNPTKAYIVIADEASTIGCEFRLATITGVLDGGTVLRECLVQQISYVNGFLDECILDETSITLGGGASALFMRCISRQGTLTINAGGSGQAINISDHHGRIKIIDKTGLDDLTIHMSAGSVELDSTVTNGIIYLDGIGKVVNNSTGTCVVVNEMMNGAELSNVQRLIELQRPHHTSTGNVWYWNPYDGDDTNPGDHISRGVKTFAKAHELVVDGNHDTVIAVPSDPAGVTITTENINITKNYMFLRGPGRDFQIRSSDDNLDAIHISGNGVEVSSVLVSTSATNTKDAIYSEGNFAYLKDLWVADAVNGIHVGAGEYSIIENVRMHHNLGYGLKFSDGVDHADVVDCHIGSNTLDGITIDINTGHEINIIGDTVIHKNSGYGVNISGTSEGVIISHNVSIFGNVLGDINDLGINTTNQTDLLAVSIADEVNTRTLDSNIVSVTDTAVTDITDFKATDIDLSGIPEAVWTYAARELTATLGLTVDQEAKLDSAVTSLTNVPVETADAVWNKVI